MDSKNERFRWHGHTLKQRFAWWLRRTADRVDPLYAPRGTHWSFTLEPGEGVQFHEDGRGCRLWYLGMVDYQRTHR